MSEWTEGWAASNSSFVNKNKDIEKVVERRRVTVRNAPGYIYVVRLTSGLYEVRTYVNGSIIRKVVYPSGTKAVLAYRELRDKLVLATKKAAEKKTTK